MMLGVGYIRKDIRRDIITRSCKWKKAQVGLAGERENRLNLLWCDEILVIFSDWSASFVVVASAAVELKPFSADFLFARVLNQASTLDVTGYIWVYLTYPDRYSTGRYSTGRYYTCTRVYILDVHGYLGMIYSGSIWVYTLGVPG